MVGSVDDARWRCLADKDNEIISTIYEADIMLDALRVSWRRV